MKGIKLKTPDTLSRLTDIYRKFSRSRRVNDRSQMCCFWEDPTVEILVGSSELDTIENEFGIEFDDESAMELYDMELGEAAVFIEKMIKEQSAQSYNPEHFFDQMTPKMAKRILLELWRDNAEVRPAIILVAARLSYEK